MKPQLQRKPRKGDRIGFGTFGNGPFNPCGPQLRHVIEPTCATMTVIKIDDASPNLCWVSYDNGAPSGPFIWNFPTDGERNLLARIFDGPVQEAS